jgi:hypothetical protein
MSEFVSVPASLWGIKQDVADMAMQALVRQGKLPADFEFRVLAIQDSDERRQIALQDIGAALGNGEPSGHPYMTQELPDCMSVPTGGTKSLFAILKEIDVDYHQLDTLLDIADDLEVKTYHGYQAWAGYVKFLDPARYARLQEIREPGPQRGSFSKLYNYQSGLLNIIIRDSALMPIYEDPALIPGHGPIKQGLLHALLQDNHPEIGLTPDA